MYNMLVSIIFKKGVESSVPLLIVNRVRRTNKFFYIKRPYTFFKNKKNPNSSVFSINKLHFFPLQIPWTKLFTIHPESLLGHSSLLKPHLSQHTTRTLYYLDISLFLPATSLIHIQSHYYSRFHLHHSPCYSRH